MSSRYRESQEIIRAATIYAHGGERAELESYSLELLKKADFQLDSRDVHSGYRKAISERISELEHLKNKTDIIDVKPNFFGLGINLNEGWRRFKFWRSK